MEIDRATVTNEDETWVRKEIYVKPETWSEKFGIKSKDGYFWDEDIEAYRKIITVKRPGPRKVDFYFKTYNGYPAEEVFSKSKGEEN